MKKTVRYLENRGLTAIATLTATLALAATVNQAQARLTGVDVYAGSGSVNWSSVHSAGISFAFTKATQGNYYEDANMAANMNNGKAAGLCMGVYDLADPASCTPGTEANYFWNYAKNYIKADGQTLLPVLDFEPNTLGESTYTGASSWSDWVNQWCNDVKNLGAAQGLDVTPIIYISAGWTGTYLSSANGWTGAWIADYNGYNSQTGSPWNGGSYYQPWGSGVWDFWQYTSSGSVSGIAHACDEDVLNGTSLSPYLVTSAYCKPAVVTPGPNWDLRDTLTTGSADISYHYGGSGDTNFVMGDWDGNGSMTPGVVRINSVGQYEWLLLNSNNSGNPQYDFVYGDAKPGDVLVVGDWDGNGTWTPGIVRTNSVGQLEWLLRNENNSGNADYDFVYGLAKDIPVVGDWDGNGTFTPGIVRGNVWYLRNANSSGGNDVPAFGFGSGGTDIPIVGDWNGDGTWSCGVVRGNIWLLRNENSTGNADISFGYGSGGDKFLVWK